MGEQMCQLVQKPIIKHHLIGKHSMIPYNQMIYS